MINAVALRAEADHAPLLASELGFPLFQKRASTFLHVAGGGGEPKKRRLEAAADRERQIRSLVHGREDSAQRRGGLPRKRLPETPIPDFTQPAWDGSPIGGKRILLYPEQGLSDVLLFVRFARELKRRGATVLVLCQALLKELLGTVDFIDHVVAEGEPLPEFDLHASMVSLPHLCRADFEAPALQAPYLKAPADSRIKLGRIEKAKLSVGIYWAGMPGRPQDRQRSVPFYRFMEFSGDPELLLFSLQGGVHQKDIQTFGAGGLVHDVGRGIFDFAEAATALSQLDLLISIDAPIAHLAAAMGLKTWVLSPSTVDWRWQLGGTRAPWYPSARLFRQPRPGDWDTVFADVRRELDQLKQR